MNTTYMVELAVLIAIILIMAFYPNWLHSDSRTGDYPDRSACGGREP